MNICDQIENIEQKRAFLDSKGNQQFRIQVPENKKKHSFFFLVKSTQGMAETYPTTRHLKERNAF